MEEKDFYMDEPCVVSFAIGEVGWLLQYTQARWRYLKEEVYKNRKFIVMMNTKFHCLIDDFVSFTIDLPDWFYDLKLETDCYEAPLAGSPAGSFTPPDVYQRLIEYLRTFYNREKAIEIWTPRGYNDIWMHLPAKYRKYTTDKDYFTKKSICVFPRGRSRAPSRNVPAYIWEEFVTKMAERVHVVLGGVPSGSYLSDFEHPNVTNLIAYNGKDKLERIIWHLNNCLLSVSSQSGLTHLSLLTGCPSYIIGNEARRHSVISNRFNAPVSFRFISDYRLIDSDTMVSDVDSFLEALANHDRETFQATLSKDMQALNNLISCQTV